MLEVEGLDAAYGELRALSEVSVRVEAGEIVALVGSNGAGKTTLLRAIAGLVRPRTGASAGTAATSWASRRTGWSSAGSPWCPRAGGSSGG